MGSPITFSGFNQIDFNVVLNAIMQQESLPLQILQQREATLRSTSAAYGLLATRLGTLQTAAEDLSNISTVTKYAATSSDPTAVTVADAGATTAGHYTVVVNSVAQAQATASTSTTIDTDTTVVASSGTLTIGGVDVTVTGDVTLSGLRDLINATSGVPATASIVETAPDTFRLVLNGKETGAANAFAITNGLTGSVTFGANAQAALNASVVVNGIPVSSTSNTLEGGIPGVAVTLIKPGTTVTVDVTRDDGDLTDRLKAFMTAYNDLAAFVSSQTKNGALGHESLLRGLHSSLRGALTTAYGAGAYTRLAEIGLGFTRTGELTLDESLLSEALTTNSDAVATLFTGIADDGAFSSVEALVDEYSQAGGLVPEAQTFLTSELSRLGSRIVDVQNRLALRRQVLQREFSAADELISRLNAQSGSLSSLSKGLISNPV